MNSISEVSIVKQQQLSRAIVAIRSDGLAWAHLTGIEEVEIEHVKEVVDALAKLGGGKKFPLLITSEKHTLPSPEARAYIATEESDPYASAEAYVVLSFSQRLMGNVYMRFNKPFRPTWIFTSGSKAVEWLKTFL